MANRKVEARLPPIMHAYLDDLAGLGAYGKDKAAVARTLIEIGIRKALTDKMISPRKGVDFPDSTE